VGNDGKFADAMTSVRVQAGVLLVIGILMLLIRRKEREPEE
jgi:nitrate reductase gamma subunit